ncbi:MAG: hypothetical protein E6H69_11745 [Betaproteobacteria bacterium]|nr:MAG: hypothetical protein E6H69_11745 [Betaproteobacteria bacterium]
MEHFHTASTAVVESHSHATMRWSAIIGGWLVATGIASLMYVAGLAIGFTAFDPYNAAATAKGIGTGTAIWMVLTWAVSLFLGGMFASWFDGRADQTVGSLHGVAVWGLSIAASGLLLAVGLTQFVQGGAAILKGGAMVGATAAGMSAQPSRGVAGPMDDAIIGLQARVTQRVAQTNARNAPGSALVVPAPVAPATAAPATPATAPPAAGAASPASPPVAQPSAADVRRAADQLDRQTMAAVATALMKGNTENAKALLAANTSMSQADIDQTLQDLSAQVDKYKADVQAAADAAARYTATAMWIIFFSSLIALVAAAIGGWLGAGHVHRVYHLRRYETAIAPPL